jgi:hypothetical protein
MNEYPKTDKERAEFWGVKIRTMFRWKGDGAPLDDYEQMLIWLSTRKNLPRSVLGKIQIPTPKNASSHVSGGTAGAAAALKRLEIMELAAFERLQAALARGNPLEIREARENWLRISESLRRYDLMIEANRRDVGELVPVTEVGTFINCFTRYFAVVHRGLAEDLVNQLIGKEPLQMYDLLRRVFDKSVVTAIFGYIKGRKSPDPRLVAYAEEAMSENYAQYKNSGLFENAEVAILNMIRWANEQPASV